MIFFIGEIERNMLSNHHSPFLINQQITAYLVDALGPEKYGILISRFQHTEGMVNSKYALPRDHSHIDSWFKPLFNDSKGQLWLPDEAICIGGFYEVLYGTIREYTDSGIAEHKIGIAIEELLRGSLRETGVDVVYGDYSQNGITGDIDCCIFATVVFLQLCVIIFFIYSVLL